MNSLERRMLDILNEGREQYHFLAVKAEFEAEGTRADELLRLLELARRAQVKVAVKIGGCEAIRDMLECRQFGVDYMIAPMVESAYALSKYIDAKNKVFASDEREDIEFLFNVETINAFNNIEEIVRTACRPEGLDGIVFGRSDFAGSLRQPKQAINTDVITDYVVEVGKHCAASGLDLVVGGNVALDSVSALQRMKATHLDRFETRKIVLSSAMVDRDDLESALRLAGEFELCWLQNKRDHYTRIAAEDVKRVTDLEKRFAVGSDAKAIA